MPQKCPHFEKISLRTPVYEGSGESVPCTGSPGHSLLDNAMILLDFLVTVKRYLMNA